MKILKLTLGLILAVSTLCAATSGLFVTPNSVAITVDKSQQVAEFPNLLTLTAVGGPVVCQGYSGLPSYNVQLTPAVGFVFPDNPVKVSVSINTTNFVVGDIVLLPVVFAFNDTTQVAFLQVSVVDSGKPPAKTANGYIPHLAYGGGWSTYLYFANASNQEQTVTANFVGESGQPLKVPTGEVWDSYDYFTDSLTVKVPPSGLRVIRVAYAKGSQPLGAGGYVAISSTGSVKTTATYKREGNFANLPSFALGQTDLAFPVVFANGWDIGFAFVNLSGSPTDVTLTLYKADGTVKWTAQSAVEAGGKRAYTLSTLVPGIKGTDFSGVLKISSSTGLVGFALNFADNGQFSPILSY